MQTFYQPENPKIELVERNGETTLYIDGQQAMQAWERGLMWESADIVCTFGSRFLEIGLGLGFSAVRIASAPTTRRHTVVEKYQRVIDLFRAQHPNAPAALEIVCADFFAFICTLTPSSLDGIFFDPYFGSTIGWDDQALWDQVVPLLVRSLRPGGALVPYFSTQPILKWPFINFFDRVLVERRPYIAYQNTEYTSSPFGSAYIQCFIKAG